MGVGPTYSFKDLVGSVSNPVVGQTILLGGGNLGAGSITLSMTTERTTHDVAADGTVMPSYVAGDNSTITIEVQQTSLLHKQLLNLYNTVKQLADADDITAWAATRVTFQTLLDGTSHKATGVSFAKIPEKVYGPSGQKITWQLMAAELVTTSNALQTALTSLASGLGV